MITRIKMRFFIARIILLGLWGACFCSLLYVSNILLAHHKKYELSVCTWGDVFDHEVIAQFEQETGIKIKLSYYTSNEELLVMLKKTQGLSFDLIVPSDYALYALRKQGLLKTIDKSSLLFWHRLNPHLLNHYFDPNNLYSIPFVWEIHGLGIDRDAFPRGLPAPTWGLLFDNSSLKRVMTNDPLDAFSIAAQYLLGNIESIDNKDIYRIRKLLIDQHAHVGAYSSLRPDYFLATKNFSIVVAPSSLIYRTKSNYPYVEFMVPREGGFMVIENLALLVSTKKDDLAYAFINFLYRPDVIAQHFNKFFYFPPTVDTMPVVDETMRTLMVSTTVMKNLSFFKQTIPEDSLNMLWVDVKTL